MFEDVRWIFGEGERPLRWFVWSALGATLFVSGLALGRLVLPGSIPQPASVKPIRLTAAEPSHPKPAAALADEQQPVSKPALSVAFDRALDEVPGHTRCPHGRRASIAPVPLHPVTEVLVKPGETVKKDQPLVKLDDDEPQADMRNKKAILDGATVQLKDSRHYLEVMEKSYQAGLVSELSYFTARTATDKAEQDEKAAKAALESAAAELEHYTLTAPIDGIVSHLDVYPGLVSRPGTTVWGEILDLGEIDVQCELTPELADRVALGQTAEVRRTWQKEPCGVAKVIFVGIAADKKTGLVPVLLRLPNSECGLRCEIPVQVRFTTKATNAETTARGR